VLVSTKDDDTDDADDDADDDISSDDGDNTIPPIRIRDMANIRHVYSTHQPCEMMMRMMMVKLKMKMKMEMKTKTSIMMTTFIH